MSTLNNKTREICLIGILSAVNIASRVALQALPNFKPVTSIIIISVLLFGLSFGIKLTVVTTIASNMILGMGTWTIFQILSWVVICLFTQCISDFYKKINKEPPLFLMAIYAFLMGYVFGFIVSLEQLIIGGPVWFGIYYAQGLLFDTFHAIGNFVFYLLCAHLYLCVYLKKKCLNIRKTITSDSITDHFLLCNKHIINI